jgi:nitroimidazol reductase NimA-like FMN-containing flavoprotein (pyridoxamine 5'-phosphate oxidase superfamily)
MDFPRLERLTAVDCRRLLPVAPLGRLAVPTPNFPTVEPVSFAVVEGELVVAVRPGSAGDALPAGAIVAFEADVLDPELRRGWSVVVKGPVEDFDADVAELVKPLVAPWPAGPGDRLLLVRSERITGQRIVSGSGPAPEAAALLPALDLVPAPVPVVVEPVVVARRSIVADEALALLRSGAQSVGRLVVTVGGEPSVFPLNYALDGDAVVFRTEVGTKLTGITRSLSTFQVDHIDASGQGWSVTLEGLAQEVLDADPAELQARIAVLALDAWPGGERLHVVRITPFAVRGTVWTAVKALAQLG